MVFSLPEIEPHDDARCGRETTAIAAKQDRDDTRMKITRVILHGEKHSNMGPQIVSELKTLAQADVMDALQFSSSRRLFSRYSGEECTTIAKALVGATSLFVFPLGEEKRNNQKHDALCAEALCSAYDACRSRVFTFDDQDDPTEFILYVYADGYTVVFEQTEKDGMVASLSRSTPGMRRMLQLYGIQHDTFGEKLVFHGERSVHGLFDILLNTTGSIRKIVAPVPFQNASLVKAPFRISSSSDDVIITASNSISIPPWVVSRLQYLLLISSCSYTISTK